jgi:serine/threonine protein kinase
MPAIQLSSSSTTDSVLPGSACCCDAAKQLLVASILQRYGILQLLPPFPSCVGLQLLLALKHPNIVRCKECFTSGSKLCIVMDWCSEGEQHCCRLHCCGICHTSNQLHTRLQRHAPASQQRRKRYPVPNGKRSTV